jgi:predicted nucleic acid-binding protein
VPTATPVKVVDASALAAVVFGEPEEDAVIGDLKNAVLTAPALLGFEMAHICVTKIRRFPGERDNILRRFAIQARYAVELAEVDHGEVVALADETGLTAYDASYLWLARKLDCQLVTLDRKLAAAANELAAS